MALTESTMMALGSTAPDFNLPSTEGTHIGMTDFSSSDILVVLFMCNHCPYVIHIAPALAKLASDYQEKGVAFVGINSNDASQYPADNYENMKKEKERWGYSFPYLLDESQDVAHAYNAACTPDIYVFNKQRALVYRGQFDDSRPHRISSGNYDSSVSPATGDSLKKAIDLLLSGEKPSSQQIAAMGCSIKWKLGNEPTSF